LRIDQPVRSSIQRLTARAANTMVRCASIGQPLPGDRLQHLQLSIIMG
jgi:hypothetical protein